MDEPGYEHDCLAEPRQDFEFRLIASDIKSAQVGFHMQSNEPVLNIEFSESGFDRFLAVQKGRVGKKIVLCFKGRLLSTPVLNEYVHSRTAQISGGFTLEEATELQSQMTEGSETP
ncbi:SecDF P1 head subdomain-containing protein [Parasphingorhabdus litoris]|uniref:SecDF P1 head subdomain-containing protein n=1 Tax=Parasphingorhabdus litoris TaxID=394733 RepID=UPI0031CEC8D0